MNQSADIALEIVAAQPAEQTGVEVFSAGEMPAEEYHAHPAVGASMLEEFRRSRRRFHGRYVAGTLPAKEPSEAMILGTLVHARLLEPDRYLDLLAPPAPELAPDGKKWLRRKGSGHEKWWQEYLEGCEGKIVADQATRDKVERIAEAVLDNRYARMLLEAPGAPEHSIFWTDEATGLRLKCRVDLVCEFPLDLKTTRDPSPRAYARQYAQLGYHRKRAHYRAGIRAWLGEERPFLHVVAGTEEPHEVAVYDPDDCDELTGLSLGEHQHRGMLERLAECFASGDWSNPWESRVSRLELPAWAFREGED